MKCQIYEKEFAKYLTDSIKFIIAKMMQIKNLKFYIRYYLIMSSWFFYFCTFLILRMQRPLIFNALLDRW